MSIQLSIVIASHRLRLIETCVAAIIAQHNPLVEIIVVADYDVTALQARMGNVRWYFHPHKSISEKRNVGIRMASGELIGFIDDDCIIASGWCAIALNWFTERSQASGVEGFTQIEQAQKSGPLREYKRLEKRGYRTNNIVYRKEALEQAGRFDERFSVQREDIDLAFSILAQGGIIDYCPELRIQHAARKSSGFDVLKNCVNRRFDPLLFKKHPIRYRKHIGTPMPFTLALMGLAQLMAGMLMLCHLKVLSGAAFGAIGLYAMGLSLRRSGYTTLVYCATESFSLLIAPWVLWGALLYGSVKYQRMLLG